MDITVQILWILAEDDKEKLIMYELFMFNKVQGGDNHVSPKGLPGYNPPATCNITSTDILNDMQMQLEENNTRLIEPITCGTSLSTHMDGLITSILP